MPDVAFQIKNSLGLADYGSISMSLQDYMPTEYKKPEIDDEPETSWFVDL